MAQLPGKIRTKKPRKRLSSLGLLIAILVGVIAPIDGATAHFMPDVRRDHQTYFCGISSSINVIIINSCHDVCDRRLIDGASYRRQTVSHGNIRKHINVFKETISGTRLPGNVILGDWSIQNNRFKPYILRYGTASIYYNKPNRIKLSFVEMLDPVKPNDRSLVAAHRKQLSIKSPARENSGDGGYEREQGRGTKYRIRLLCAFIALTLMGMASATVGVYCACYAGSRFTALGLLLWIVGGASFIIGFGSIVGVALIY